MNRPVTEIPGVPDADGRPVDASAELEIERARVLVVDDDERNLLALQTVLEDLGEVVLARSGEGALRHLLKGEFAVILLDVYMPGMDGYETAQIIRNRDQSKGIPIVFLSAVNKEAEHLLRGYSMGAVDYVFKPVDPIVLRSKVAVFVDLFEKTKEIERKARQEQALMDANLRANADLLRAEQDLRRAEQRQAAIIQSLPMILYLEPLEANPRRPAFVGGDLEAITGFPHEYIFDNPQVWSERIHPEDRDRLAAAMEARRKTGRSSVEYRWQCADGTYKHILDQAVLLTDSGDDPAEFAGTLTDISEQRSLENQLIQAQKMDAIGKLTGGIAHDFNNLLAAVIGGLSLLEKRTQLEAEQQRILGMTMRAAEQGSELVRRLLAFARRQKLEPQAISLEALQLAMSDLLSHTLGGLVNIEWHLKGPACAAYVDRAQLELALINLIINARDAMPTGGTIKIKVARCTVGSEDLPGAKAGQYVRVAVVDTGTGISPTDIEKVTEPFFTTKAVGKGSGLGLSMVYGFAKQSGGALTIESALNKGTTATLWLPCAPAGLQSKAPFRAERSQSGSTRKLSVLLVDDHDEVRSTTAALLEDFGHEVHQASNGADAMRLLENQCPCDLIISDYAMPHLSGTDFLTRARDLRPGIPALIITGYADIGGIGERPEAVDVLLKPFTPIALKTAIAGACRDGGSAGRCRPAASRATATRESGF